MFPKGLTDIVSPFFKCYYTVTVYTVPCTPLHGIGPIK